MRQVIKSKDEWDLFGVASDLDVLGVNDKDAAEAGTIFFGEDVGAGELFEFLDYVLIYLSRRKSNLGC